MRLTLREAYLNNLYESVETYESTSAPPADTNGQTVTLNQEELSAMQNFATKKITAACNAGKFIPLETCQLYYLPTSGTATFCMDTSKGKVLYLIFSYNDCAISPSYQNCWSMFIRTPKQNNWYPVHTGNPVGMYAPIGQNSWAHYHIKTQRPNPKQTLDYWICLQAPDNTNLSVINLNSSCPRSQTTAPPVCSNPPNKNQEGIAFFFTPSYVLNGVVQDGHYCNNSNLVFSDTNSGQYSADDPRGQVPGQTRNTVWSNTKVLCETTTVNKNVVKSCGNLCKKTT